jgi:hypothetical protein
MFANANDLVKNICFHGVRFVKHLFICRRYKKYKSTSRRPQNPNQSAPCKQTECYCNSTNMKFRVSYGLPMFLYQTRHGYLHKQHRCFTSFFRKLQTTTQARTSINGGSGSSQGQSILRLRACVFCLELWKLTVHVICLLAEKIEEF